MAADPYYYTMAVAEEANSYRLLQEINQFICWFKQQPERKKIENHWQGGIIEHSLSFRDESGNLHGEEYLAELYRQESTWQA